MASRGLEHTAVEHYLPVYKRLTAWGPFRNRFRNPREVARPLFPGYVFVRFDPKGGLQPILRLPGVNRLITFGKELAQVNHQEIESVQIAVASGLALKEHTFTVGQEVRIVHGPLRNASGTVASIDGETFC
jgi:transcriptional antiterminator RfaH